jgi:hypothetical protein
MGVEDHKRKTALGELISNGQSGLASTNDHRLDSFRLVPVVHDRTS